MIADTFRIALLLSIVRTIPCDFSGYAIWRPAEIQRDDLYCDFKICNEWSTVNVRPVIECCVCLNKAEWEFPNNASDSVSLEVEYINRRGLTNIVEPNEVNSTRWYYLTHEQGFMNSLPNNLCNFPSLVKINLADNDIADIEGISCVSQLDTLILRKNRISYVKNTTFEGLSFLRKLDLTENIIEKIEPCTFSKPGLSFFEILLPYNKMTTIDMTNIALDKPFCEINASHNKIEAIVNEGGLIMNESISYGEGGMVSLRNNQFTSFPEFTKLGIPDLALLGKLMSFGFDLREAKWTCDAKMVPFLQLAEITIKKVWRDYFDVKCYLPERLRGESIPKLVLDNRLEEFTSEMSGKEGCPNMCKCIYYPVSNVTTVRCTSSLLHMPSEMPEEGLLDIDFSETQISKLVNTSYISRISRINLNHTRLENIPLAFIDGIHNYLSWMDLSNTPNLYRLTTTFKILDHCKIYFGNKIIFCNCDSQWIQDWIDATSCRWNSSLTCRTTQGIVPLTMMSDALGCEEENRLFRYLSIALSVVILFLVITFGTVYLYRHEIRILLKRHKNPNKIKWEKYKFDVYVSFNERNEQLLGWILKICLPELRRAGYTVHCPILDASAGTSVDEEVINNISQSRNFIIFLSDEYLDDLCTFDSIEGIRINLEWRHAWHHYRKSRERRFIIINYDLNRICEINRRELKAFLRVGKVLDFANKKHSLLNDVKELLGIPQRRFRGLGARKTIFNVNKTQLREKMIDFDDIRLKNLR